MKVLEENSPQLEGWQKEDLQTYVEKDDTGIVPALLNGGAIILENGMVRFTRMIDRDKFLYTREYFKHLGLKWTGNFRMVVKKAD